MGTWMENSGKWDCWGGAGAVLFHVPVLAVICLVFVTVSGTVRHPIAQ